MFKVFLRFASASAILSLLISGQVFAISSGTNVSVLSSQAKSASKYDVVAKGNPGTKLELFVNGKNPVKATVDKQSHATFHNVKLANTGKLTFSSLQKNKSGNSYQPLNYTEYYSVANKAVTFSATPVVKSTPTPKPTKVQVAATPVATPVPTPLPTPIPTPIPTQAPAATPECDNGTYINSVGNTVCSPEQESSVPAGATAQCVDGTYSFSQSHSGTCSHHGGVSQWLD